jgi:hypothetical protein
VADGWTDIARRIGISLMNRRQDAGNLDMEEVMRCAEIADFQKMNEIRAASTRPWKTPRSADR